MCFSAKASLAAATVLSVVSVATFKNMTTRSQFFLASIPLLFALQQLSEGLIWLYLKHDVGTQGLFQFAKYSFLSFAFFLWPIWIPLSLAVLEKVNWRRYALFLVLLCGTVLSVVNLFYALQQEASVEVIHYSLKYMGHVPSQKYLYPLIVLLPFFLSSLKNVWLLGVLAVASYLIAKIFFSSTFVSVWCFFAAIMSLSVYKILKNHTTSLKKPLF